MFMYRSDKYGELVNKETYFAWTPLYYILERKNAELVRLLVSKGAGK